MNRNRYILAVIWLILLTFVFTSYSFAGSTGINSIQYNGDLETPGSTAVTVWMRDSSGYVSYASGATVPTDAEAGYAKGCIFIQTDGGVSSTLYVNEGTYTSCDFNTGNVATTWISLTDTPGSITANTIYGGNAGGTALEAKFVIGTMTATSGNVLVANGTSWGTSTPDSAGLVAKTGSQTIAGDKTFSDNVNLGDDVTLTGGKKHILRAATEYIYSSGVGQVDIDALTAVQIATGTLDVNAAMTLSGNLLHETTAEAQFRDADLKVYSSVDGQLDIEADTEVEIDTTTVDINGNVDISGTVAVASALTMGTTNKVQLRDTGLYINSSVDGQMDIDADTELEITAPTTQIVSSTLVDMDIGGLDVDATAAINLATTYNNAAAIGIVTNGGTSEKIVMTNTQGTDEAALTFTATAGGIDMDAAAAKNIDIAGGQVLISSKDDAASAIALTANIGTSETIVLTNTQGTAAGALTFVATAGGVDIDAAATKDVDIAGGQVLISSKDDAASAIGLTTNVGTSETIVLTNTQGTAEGALTLTATAGGIDADAAAGKNIDIAGGQVLISSKDNAASAIALTANTGASETIVVTNTQGTGQGAITFTATAGGVTIASSAGVYITCPVTIKNAVNYVALTQDGADYDGNLSPAIDGYVTGMQIIAKVDADNAAACDINLNGLGDKAIKTVTGADPAAADLDASGVHIMIYDGTNFVLINPATTTD